MRPAGSSTWTGPAARVESATQCRSEAAQHIGLRCLRSLTTLRLRCDTRALDCSNAAAVIHARP
jgi:hypothetical protein